MLGGTTIKTDDDTDTTSGGTDQESRLSDAAIQFLNLIAQAVAKRIKEYQPNSQSKDNH